jgi:hypothetical protein
MLDGPLLMRAVVRLLDHTIGQVERGTTLQVRYALENDEIRIAIGKFEANLRSVVPPGSLRPASLRPTASLRPARAPQTETSTHAVDLEFVHLAAEAHGGKLMVGTSALYRICLPWVETKLRR